MRYDVLYTEYTLTPLLPVMVVMSCYDLCSKSELYYYISAACRYVSWIQNRNNLKRNEKRLKAAVSVYPVAMWLQRNRWIAAAEITVIDETNKWGNVQHSQLTKFRPQPMPQWHCCVTAVSLLCHRYATAVSLLCHCYVTAVLLLCHCCVTIVSLLCYCYATAVSPPLAVTNHWSS